MTVFLGADHKGYEFAKSLEKALRAGGIEVEFIGSSDYTSDDDYVDFGALVGRKVVENTGSRGILVCGSGVGMDIAANKIKGVRAFLGYSPELVSSARNDDDVNVMALGSEFTDESTAVELARLFLETPFDASERRIRRLEKIKELENL